MTRFLCAVLLIALGAPFLVGNASAQDQYPSHPVKIIVPFAPGGGTDTIARLVASGMEKALHGQKVFIENRPGAGTIIGAAAAAHADPDGYTLMVTVDQTFTMNSELYRKLSYDPQKDFLPISMLARGPRLYVANPNLPVKTLKDLVEYAKKNPGKLNYGSGAISSQVVGEELMQATGIKMVFIPFNGGAPALTALLGDNIQLAIADIGTLAPNINSGRLTGLAISSSHRSTVVPNVPTLAELGYPELENTGWWGLFAPAGTPQKIIETLNKAVAAALADKTVRERIVGTGNDPEGSTPEELNTIAQKEARRWSKVIQAAGMPKR